MTKSKIAVVSMAAILIALLATVFYNPLYRARPTSFPPPSKSPASLPPATELPPGVKGYREVFYATDRAPGPENSFGDDAAESQTLALGRVVISIPESHQRGEVERPWHVFSISMPENAARDMIIHQRERLNPETFFGRLSRSIDDSPEKDAFVFVHGFNVAFDEALLKTAQFAWDMKFQGPAVTYSWPSAGSAKKYVSDIDMADWSAPHLSLFLRDLRRVTGSRTVHLVAHSMGSRVLTAALERLALMDPNAVDRFQEVVLAAPDINARVFEQLSAALKTKADRITIYTSDRDRALKASALLRQGKARLGSSAATAQRAGDYDVIDATRARASLLNHSYFAEDSQLIGDLSLLLRLRLAPGQRSVTLDKAGAIWVFHP